MRTVIFLVSALIIANPATAQKVDPDAATANKVAEKLTEDSKPLLPPGTELWLRAEDGRIYQWSITLPADSQREVVLLSNPPRLVSFEISEVKDGFGGGKWLREMATVYDAKNGKELAKKDLTPTEGTLPKVEPGK